MNIDITSIVISAIALGAFAVPVVYDQVQKKKVSQKFENNFLETAQKHDLNLEQHDTWRDTYAIGLDSSAGKLLYFKQGKNKNKEQVLNLAEVKHCETTKSGSRSRRSSGVNKVELEYMTQGSDKEKTLEFFSNGNYQQLRNEVQIAEKWKKIINQARS